MHEIKILSARKTAGILKFGSRARALSKFKAASDDNFADEIYAASARRIKTLGADKKRTLFKWRLNQKRQREQNFKALRFKSAKFKAGRRAKFKRNARIAS